MVQSRVSRIARIRRRVISESSTTKIRTSMTTPPGSFIRRVCAFRKYMLSVRFSASEYEPRSDGSSYWNSRIVTTTELLHSRFEGVPLRFNRNHFEAELGFPPSPNPDPRPPAPQPPEPRLP